MILTGKAKEDFLKWFSNYSEKNHSLKGLYDKDIYLDGVELPKELINALIIEWFDSVGIYINIENLYYQSWWSYKVKIIPNTFEEKVMVKTRSEATEQAIKKANGIYNEM